MKYLLSRLWQPRWLRVIVWIGIAVVTLFILAYQYVNWQGGRAWTASLAALENNGETMEFRDLMPVPVPDEDNFCSLPLLKNIAMNQGNSHEQQEAESRRKLLGSLSFPSNQKPTASPKPGLGKGGALAVRTDLKAWADWMKETGAYKLPEGDMKPEQAVLQSLDRDKEIYDVLTAGLNRPEALWLPHWKTRDLPEFLYAVTVPHYNVASSMYQPLALRSIAAARAGSQEVAFNSLQILLRFSRASLNDPSLIGTLVAASGDRMGVIAAWELCDARFGQAGDWAQLEQEMAKHDYASRLLAALRSEMIVGADAIFSVKKKYDPQLVRIVVPDNNQWADNWLLSHAIPGGFYDLNAATLVNVEYEYLVKPLHEQGLLTALQRSVVMIDVMKQRKEKMYLHPGSIMAAITVPLFNPVMQRILYTQTLLDMAQTACVLERYYAEHQNYPDSLQGLTGVDGTPLPLDITSGQTIGYQKTPDDRYRLWCVGLDGKDDHGTVRLDEKEPNRTKFDDPSYQGDWVWDYTTPLFK